MGDLSDMNDIDRFLRCEAGKKHLESLRSQLVGKRITDVTFSNEVFGIMTTLHLDNGGTFLVLDLSLTIETLRDEFPEAIEEEYYKDYPERKPQESPRR
jgi:hypothetical protein